MRRMFWLTIAVMPLVTGCESILDRDIGDPPSLRLENPIPVGPEDILSELTPTSNLLAGGTGDDVTPPPTEAVGDYRFHDHRNADAAQRFLDDLNAAVSTCDERAYAAARQAWLDRRYEAEAQERSSLSSTAAYADSAPKREADEAEFERLYREKPRYPWPCPPGSEPARSTLFAYGSGTTLLPRTGIGFKRPMGGEEWFAVKTADEFDTEKLTLEWFTPFRDWQVGIGLEYGWGDAETFRDIPAMAGIDTGVVYGGLSEAGSSGVNIGDRGSQNETTSEFDYWNLKFKAFLDNEVFPKQVRPFVYGDILKTDTRHRMSFFYEGVAPPPGTYILEQDRDQRLDEIYLGGGFGAVLSQDIGDRWRAYAIPSVGVFWRKSDLDSWEWNRCNFCPMSDRDWVFETTASDDDLAYTATVALALEYRLSQRASIGVGANYTWLDKVGAISNPRTGDQVYYEGRETSLTSKRAESYGWQVGLRYGF